MKELYSQEELARIVYLSQGEISTALKEIEPKEKVKSEKSNRPVRLYDRVEASKAIQKFCKPYRDQKKDEMLVWEGKISLARQLGQDPTLMDLEDMEV